MQVASGATLDLSGYAQTIDSLANSGGGGGIVTNSVAGSAALTLAPTGTSTFGGSIQDGAGQVSLIMDGSGTQIFTGSNTYTGTTNLVSGVLEIAGSGGAGTYTGPFSVAGGTLEIAGPGAIDNTSALTGNGLGTVLLVPGGSLKAGNNVNYSGIITLAGGALTVQPGATPTVGSLLMTSGTVALAASQTMYLTGNGGLLMSPGAGATFNMTGG